MTIRKFWRTNILYYSLLLHFFLTARFHHFFVVVIHLCTITAKIDEEILFFLPYLPDIEKENTEKEKNKKRRAKNQYGRNNQITI